MRAQHHGRDQVLEGWNLNQWQPGEGDSKGTLGRKEGTGLLPKPWLSEERGMRREGDESPKVGGGHSISQMCPSTSQAAAHGMCAEVRGFAKAHTQPLHGARAAQAPDGLEKLHMVLEQGSEELTESTAVLLEGCVREEDAVMARRGQQCRDAGQGVDLMLLPTSSKSCLPTA